MTNLQLTFSPIPSRFHDALLRIDASSNPRAWQAQKLSSAYHSFQHLGAFSHDEQGGNGEDSELVAFVLYQCMADEAEIIHLVCDRKHQRKGYTQQLLNALLHQLRQNAIRTLFLEVHQHNIGAQRLYEKIGFKTIGKRKNYYDNQFDAIIQRIDLAD